MSLYLVFVLLIFLLILSHATSDFIVEMTGRFEKYSTGHLGVFLIVFGLALFCLTLPTMVLLGV